ncbi:MAG TPA: HD domain-containing protein [Patescibacteria group bacterium]|nr:HD domain-containing protein [Patescibacteria group bacterium]
MPKKKKVSYPQIIKELTRLVESACREPANSSGYGAWSYHIVPVVKYAKLLAKKLKADMEVVEIAGLLHDYASILNKDWYPDHHFRSAQLAEELLKKYHLPPQKIKAIKHCILSHRASKRMAGKTLESAIIASADSIAHFDNVDSLLYLAYVQHKMGIDQGKKWVLAKLERSWQKLIPEGKKLVEKKYQSIKEALA